jgi:hypothetical protein
MSVLKTQGGEVPSLSFRPQQNPLALPGRPDTYDQSGRTIAKKRMKQRVRNAAERSATDASKTPHASSHTSDSMGQGYFRGMTPGQAKQAITAATRRNDAVAAEESAWTFSVAGESPSFWKGLSEAVSSTAETVVQQAQQMSSSEKAEVAHPETEKSKSTTSIDDARALRAALERKERAMRRRDEMGRAGTGM